MFRALKQEPVMNTTDGVFRYDARAKATGRAKYAGDIKVTGMAHAVPVYTRFVRARGLRVDTAAAKAAPGVLAVLVAADVPGQVRYGQIEPDYPVLAQDFVNFEGEVIALVVAQTRAQALAAAALVVEEAEELPPLLDPAEALEPAAPLLRLGKKDNLVNHGKMRRGDAEKALASCDLVLDERFSTQFIEHAYMEPEAAVAIPRPDGVMEIHGSMQHPFSTRRFVAAALGSLLAGVEVFNPPMGGGFGGKDDTAALVCARAALAARAVRRPVKLVYDREWSMRESYKRHPYKLHYRVGFGKDGTFRAASIDMLCDSGAYTSVTPWVNWRSLVQCCGPYAVADVHTDIYAAATNNVFTGAMRGFGSPQVNFAIEQLMDMAAERLGLSPLEIRRINMLKQDGVTVTGQKLDGHVVSLSQVLDTIVRATDFEKKLGASSRGVARDGKLYGIGLALSYRGASLGAEGADFCSSIVNCQADGSVILDAAIHENGQGAESVQMLILAEELGIPLELIRHQRSSTSMIPDGGTTVATRGTIMGGGAVAVAARELKALMARSLAPKLGVESDRIVFRSGRVGAEGGPSMSWKEAVAAMFESRIYPYAFGTFRAPNVSWDEETGQGDAYFTYVYSCQAAEVEVDAATGAVRLLAMTAAHDVGRAINRALTMGQAYGGMVQAAGMALFEDLGIKDGRVGNRNLDRYKIPRAREMPDLSCILVENADPTSPTGAKGIGEPAIEIMAPAIANAVYNATGIRCRDLPIRIDPKELS
jgi:CO/xanthine dehydrogenase Mo-binding subunit